MAAKASSKSGGSPADPPKAKVPLLFIWGDDEYLVKKRARAVYQAWTAEVGGEDHEIIDGAVSNGGEALRALARVRESLQTLPFFGSGKVVWLKDCSFLGDDRTSGAQAVTENLASLGDDLKRLNWSAVRLLISALKVDRRKSFYKTLEKLGECEAQLGLSADDRDWMMKAETLLGAALKRFGKTIDPEAAATMVGWVGPNSRQLESEAEKLAAFLGDRPRASREDVDTVGVRNRQARAFALAEAVGERDLPGALRALEEEFWSMKTDAQKNEIALLYGVISKVRNLLITKELIREGHLRYDRSFDRFKAQLGKSTASILPEDRRFNPLSMHPFALHKTAGQASRYETPELVRAMGLLLDCNRRLVSSDADERLVLQRVLVEILGGERFA